MQEIPLKKKCIYKGRAVNFHVHQVKLPNGRIGIREYLGHPGAVAAIPFLDKKTIILVRQFRYPVGQTTYELPAGKLERKENPSRCMKRELVEETGYSLRQLKHLISYWPTPAFSNEVIHIYTATGLKKGKPCPDEDEFISIVEVPIRKALSWIRAGKIMDSKTIIALLTWTLQSQPPHDKPTYSK